MCAPFDRYIHNAQIHASQTFLFSIKTQAVCEKTDVLLDSIVRHRNRRAIFPKKELDT